MSQNPQKRLTILGLTANSLSIQENYLWHCATRLFERYGIREEETEVLIKGTLLMVYSETYLYTYAQAEVHQVKIGSRFFYPVICPGWRSKKRIVKTFLSEEMVWNNMLFGRLVRMPESNKPRSDALLDFADDL
jgi:hypothetical protein